MARRTRPAPAFHAQAFWGPSTVVQFFVFDASPYVRGPLMKIGYYTLTATFVYLTIVFAWAAARA